MDPVEATDPERLEASPEAAACSICLDLVVDCLGARSITRLRCGHEFHLDCIGSAFNAKGAMQCPNCRKVEKGRWLYANGDRRCSDSDLDEWIEAVDFVSDHPFGFLETYQRNHEREHQHLGDRLVSGISNHSTGPLGIEIPRYDDSSQQRSGPYMRAHSLIHRPIAHLRSASAVAFEALGHDHGTGNHLPIPSTMPNNLFPLGTRSVRRRTSLTRGSIVASSSIETGGSQELSLAAAANRRNSNPTHGEGSYVAQLRVVREARGHGRGTSGHLAVPSTLPSNAYPVQTTRRVRPRSSSAADLNLIAAADRNLIAEELSTETGGSHGFSVSAAANTRNNNLPNCEGSHVAQLGSALAAVCEAIGPGHGTRSHFPSPSSLPSDVYPPTTRRVRPRALSITDYIAAASSSSAADLNLFATAALTEAEVSLDFSVTADVNRTSNNLRRIEHAYRHADRPSTRDWGTPSEGEAHGWGAFTHENDHEYVSSSGRSATESISIYRALEEIGHLPALPPFH